MPRPARAPAESRGELTPADLRAAEVAARARSIPAALRGARRRPSHRAVAPAASEEIYTVSVAGSADSTAHCLKAHQKVNASHSRVQLARVQSASSAKRLRLTEVTLAVLVPGEEESMLAKVAVETAVNGMNIPRGDRMGVVWRHHSSICGVDAAARDGERIRHGARG